jgi:thiol-disulfide isomerase/thioredoxin
VQSKDVVMVDFYAPWCIWCQRLAPVWENFAHTVGEKDYSDFVGVAKVDCTTEAEICRRRRIAGYPSIFLYRDRNPHSHTAYHGDRTTAAFISHIEGLGVESDHKQEVADLLDDIQGELNAESNVVKKAAFKQREKRVDASINHPLKSLTAPGGMLGPNSKDSSLTGIMRALDQAGMSRSSSLLLRCMLICSPQSFCQFFSNKHTFFFSLFYFTLVLNISFFWSIYEFNIQLNFFLSSHT